MLIKAILLLAFIVQLANGSGAPRRLLLREELFAAPKHSQVSLSPDGKTLAYLAPNEYGIKNVYTRCVTCKHTVMVTFDKKRNINGFQWTGVPGLLLYFQDVDGDENDRLYKVNISNPSEPISISDRPGLKAVIIGNDRRHSKIVLGINDENPAFHNVYEFDLLTNEQTLVMRNRRFPLTMFLDNDLQIRLVSAESEDDGSMIYYQLSPTANRRKLTCEPENWIEYVRVQQEDRSLTVPLAFTSSNEQMYWQWGPGTDLGSLVIHEFGRPQSNEILFTPIRAQIGTVLMHPTDKTILAVTEEFHKPEYYAANQTIMDDLQYLVNLNPNAIPMVIDISQDFHTWLVAYFSDVHPHQYYLYRRWQKKAEYLFSSRPELEAEKFAPMFAFEFPARDGLPVQAYITLPITNASSTITRSPKFNILDNNLNHPNLIPSKPLPTVLLVHGGPRARDRYGFSTVNAWLADRGYAVLQVNFRGSAGFGKKHTNAGNGEWGRRMHYDLLDAVQLVVAKGISDKKKIAIMGGSYGGYAVLNALTVGDDDFACGIDIVGPSNLITLLETIPPYWRGFYNEMITMLGADTETVEGRQTLKSRSPLYFAERVRKPLLIMHGANDPRVKRNESDQFVQAMQRNRIPVTYVLYPDEGHGFRRTENRLSEAGFIERFLYKCLEEGYYQNYEPGMYKSSAQVISEDDRLTTSKSNGSVIESDILAARSDVPQSNADDFFRNMFATMGG